MSFGLTIETRNDSEYVRNIAFWVRKLFDGTRATFKTLTTTQEVRVGGTIYLVDTTSGSVVVTLPLAKDANGEYFVFKKVVAANTMTIDGAGSETIDGATTQAFTTQWSVVTIASNGTEWYVVA
jgi:hypothetical protein